MTKTKLSFSFNGFLLLIFCYAIYTSLGFLNLAKPYPLTISIIGVVLTLVNAVRLIPKILRENRGDYVAAEENEYEIAVTHEFKIASLNFLWFLGYLVGIFLIGFYIATVIFITVFLKKKTDFSWFNVVLSLVITIAGLLIFDFIMRIDFPLGLLFVYL